jgi:hypothetical protein
LEIIAPDTPLRSGIRIYQQMNSSVRVPRPPL